jgi:hypothetical protein
MEKTCDSIEKTLMFIKNHKNWFNFYGDGLKRSLELYDSGYMMVSKERDYEGRRIVMCANKMDLNKFNSDDIVRLYFLVFTAIALEEESQIGGVIFIHDARYITFNYIAKISIKTMYDFSMEFRSFPVRLQGMILMGLPSVAQQLWNISKATYSEKLLKRVSAVDDIAGLRNLVDVSILAKEYGGTLSVAEIAADFRPKIVENATYWNDFCSKFDVDFYKANKSKDVYGTELIGSFRKLEID